MSDVRLETDRLLLRQFRDSDFDAFAAMNADPECIRYIGEGRPLDRGTAWRKLAMFIGHWKLRGYGFWAAEERASGAFVGNIGLHFPEGWPGPEVGWQLRQEYWGKGFATEGATAARDYAFEVLGLERLISLIHPDNARSIAVAERLGERYERRTEILGQTALVYALRRPEGNSV